MPLKHKDKRLLIGRLFLDLTRQLGQFNGESNWGSRADMLLIVTGVFIGHAEGKPMSAHKLSTYVGMPRATVTRKLQTLAAEGVVEAQGSKWRLTQAFAQSEELLSLVAQLEQTIRSTATMLSRLDKPGL
jgi:CRP-like cAMP-binding protein